MAIEYTMEDRLFDLARKRWETLRIARKSRDAETRKLAADVIRANRRESQALLERLAR